MNRICRKRLWVALMIALLAGTGCFGRGIRQLSAVETEYFARLDKQLKSSSKAMESLLEENTAFNEEAALRESARLRQNVRRAKLIYSIREVLKAPRGDRSGFIQETRNKVVLYHLAEAAQAEDELVTASLALGVERRRQLAASLSELRDLVQVAIASNQLLYNHLNRDGSAQLSDFIAEVGRQVSAFNEGIQKADQENPAIQKMVAAGLVAQERAEQANEGLSRFIGIWAKLNEESR